MGYQVVGERIEQRRKQLGLTLDDIAQELGVAKSTIQRYEKGTIDRVKLPIIEAIARVIEVNPAWICGKTDSMEPEKASGLTDKDRRDVARDVDKIMDDLSRSGDLMFDGVPMSDAARAAMAAAMRIGLEEARKRNKETYTPKKYKKR